MRNPSIEKTKEKLIKALPTKIRGVFEAKFNTLSQGVDTVDTGSKETETEKDKEYRGIVKGDLLLEEEEVRTIARKYSVPIEFVLSKQDDVNNWINEIPSRRRGRNLKLTLINWIKRDVVSQGIPKSHVRIIS